MGKYLVDSSVWINFFNQKNEKSEKVKLLHNLIQNDAEIYLCPIVFQEVLQGVRDDKLFEKMKSILKFFPMVSIDILSVTEYAIDLFRNLRKHGITIRKSADCLISSYAILGNMTLLQEDIDFERIAEKTLLKLA